MASELYGPLPWHNDVWHRIIRANALDRLPHGLMLQGSRGIGKHWLAMAIAHFMLCEKRQYLEWACGECKSCLLNKAETHPDFVRLEPEGNAQAIKIAQIRDLITWVGKTANMGGYRIIVLAPTEALTTSAANALLKSLEEPGADTVFILVTHRSSGVMPTIRSRCQPIALRVPERSMAMTWLQQQSQMSANEAQSLLNAAGGAPLSALDMLSKDTLKQRKQWVNALISIRQGAVTPVQVAQQMQSGDVNGILTWMLAWVNDWLKLASGVSTDYILNHDLIDHWQPIMGSVSVSQLFVFLDKLLEAKRNVLGQANPNQQLLLEDLLITWQKG